MMSTAQFQTKQPKSQASVSRQRTAQKATYSDELFLATTLDFIAEADAFEQSSQQANNAVWQLDTLDITTSEKCEIAAKALSDARKVLRLRKNSLVDVKLTYVSARLNIENEEDLESHAGRAIIACTKLYQAEQAVKRAEDRMEGLSRELRKEVYLCRSVGIGKEYRKVY